jgi:hypothetical protein
VTYSLSSTFFRLFAVYPLPFFPRSIGHPKELTLVCYQFS